MAPRFVRPIAVTAFAILAVAVSQPGGSEPAMAEDSKPSEKITFGNDIKPLLADKCGKCHGSERPKKGLDYVTSYETIMKSVKAGKPDESRLYRSIAGKGGKPMPPKTPLTEAEIAKIKTWIADGAKKN